MPKVFTTYMERRKAAKQLSPDTEIVFLDNPQGLARDGDTIADGFPLIVDYGATFGTAFRGEIRQEVAQARQEKEPLETVSVVAFKNTFHKWMDNSRLHPQIRPQVVEEHSLDILQGISFIRYPCNTVCEQEAGPNYVNDNKEVQVFVVPDTDPLLNYLEKKKGISWYGVRSSNIAGRQEEPCAKGARQYAGEIASPLVAIRNIETLEMHHRDEPLLKSGNVEELERQRVGSQPIIRLPQVNEPPRVQLKRPGNTDPKTVERLMRDTLINGVTLETSPEKATAFKRKTYSVHPDIKDPESIRLELLQKSNCL